MLAQAGIQTHHPQGYRFSTGWTLSVTWIFACYRGKAGKEKAVMESSVAYSDSRK